MSTVRTHDRLEPILTHPWLTRLLRVKAARLRYRGRRSDREISLSVWCRPTPTGVRIDVGAPNRKTWWRNFTGNPTPVEVLVDDDWHHGTGLVTHPRPGRVRVEVTYV